MPSLLVLSNLVFFYVNTFVQHVSDPSTKVVSKILQDPFDYRTEDELLRLWNEEKDWNGCLALKWERGVPGWGHFWYGPGSNPGDTFQGDLKKKYSGTYDREVEDRKQSKL